MRSRQATGLPHIPSHLLRKVADIGSARRSVVPFSEILTLQEEMAQQLSDLPDGATFHIQVED